MDDQEGKKEKTPGQMLKGGGGSTSGVGRGNLGGPQVKGERIKKWETGSW